ncbi:hypothetical protein [Crocosphaera sp. XPORK-15E]|uniref:hypothetical protein n=1 Tax=Crocosphaera sp. XPORK-15E TaxID=3110247 RepID=UPI002B1F0B78|nr:hypothetical protein [Crocosphaera sp. XPORK-15E]MEA5537048.1 hypothetical protein [Crocosphaera sp. XPORK-15E]
MNYSTHLPQKTTQATTLNKPYLTSMPTFSDVEESEELTPSEQAWFERWENQHLTYSDIDLHY